VACAAGPGTTSRAALLIAICAGVILDRMLLGHSALNSPDTESLLPYLSRPSQAWRQEHPL
jgi:hypothetical protein